VYNAQARGTSERHKPYGDTLATHVALIYQELQEMGETITISAIARRAGASRASVRAVLRDVFDWTPAHSQLAYQEGKKRGHLLQTVAGHPGLARGRSTLAAQGWPNLHRGQQTLAATGYAGLDRGRTTQASKGWPGLREERRKREVAGHPQLEKGRQNLAMRSWPNWQKAHTVLAAQGYLPLLEGRLLTPRQRPCPETDRRVMRGRSTRLAILEALEALQEQECRRSVDTAQEAASTSGREPRVTGRELASRLQLHPTTVYGHLKQLRTLGIIEQQA
jgi:DNA-binding transcriptional ArsR family regulator